MGNLEKRLLKDASVKPLLYLCYIDDIFFIFDQGEDRVLGFLDYMNEQHPTIKFTMEYSKEQVNFLDTIFRVDKTAGTLYTELYTNETDTLHLSTPLTLQKRGPIWGIP